MDGQQIAQVEHFYAADQQAVFDTGTPIAKGNAVIWQASELKLAGGVGLGWVQRGIGALTVGGIAFKYRRDPSHVSTIHNLQALYSPSLSHCD